MLYLLVIDTNRYSHGDVSVIVYETLVRGVIKNTMFRGRHCSLRCRVGKSAAARRWDAIMLQVQNLPNVWLPEVLTGDPEGANH